MVPETSTPATGARLAIRSGSSRSRTDEYRMKKEGAQPCRQATSGNPGIKDLLWRTARKEGVKKLLRGKRGKGAEVAQEREDNRDRLEGKEIRKGKKNIIQNGQALKK